MTNVKVYDNMWYCYNPERKEEVPLVYLTHHEFNKAFEKRKETGLSWAGRAKAKEDTFKNDWIEGFTILDNRSRYSTRNVVWRVFDPRGFQLEIQSWNMMELLRNGVLDHGSITGKCKWGREGGYNVLIPEGSDLWKTVSTTETRVALRINPRELAIGDVVKTIRGNKRAIYLGKFLKYNKPWGDTYYPDIAGSRIRGTDDEAHIRARYTSERHVLVELDAEGKPDFSKVIDQGTRVDVHSKEVNVDLSKVDIELLLFETAVARDYLWDIYLRKDSPNNVHRLGYRFVYKEKKRGSMGYGFAGRSGKEYIQYEVQLEKI